MCGDLFLPIRLEAEDLAEAYPDALSDELGPVDNALANLERAHPEINTLIDAAA